MTCQYTGTTTPVPGNAEPPPPPLGGLAFTTCPLAVIEMPFADIAFWKAASLAAAWALVSSCGSNRAFAWRPDAASVRETQSAVTVFSPAMGRAEALVAGMAMAALPRANAAIAVMRRDGMGDLPL